MEHWSIRLKHLLIGSSLLLAIGCSEKPDRIALELLKVDSSKDYLDFCQSYSFDWDSILIVTPYSRFESLKDLNLRNFSTLKEELKIMESIDWKHYLLFIEGNGNLTAFAEIPRGYLDFEFEDQSSSPKYIYQFNCELKISNIGKFSTIWIAKKN